VNKDFQYARKLYALIDPSIHPYNFLSVVYSLCAYLLLFSRYSHMFFVWITCTWNDDGWWKKPFASQCM